MPGKHITKQQVHLYMKKRNEGLAQITSAAKAAMSERSGRRIESGQLQPKKNACKGSSRKDPLAMVWELELIPRLEAEPQLAPITLLEVLQKTILRSIQIRYCVPYSVE